jgi:hypothetical protein
MLSLKLAVSLAVLSSKRSLQGDCSALLRRSLLEVCSALHLHRLPALLALGNLRLNLPQVDCLVARRITLLQLEDCLGVINNNRLSNRQRVDYSAEEVDCSAQSLLPQLPVGSSVPSHNSQPPQAVCLVAADKLAEVDCLVRRIMLWARTNRLNLLVPACLEEGVCLASRVRLNLNSLLRVGCSVI